MTAELDYQALNCAGASVVTSATDYPDGHVIPLHRHSCAQLLYATRGVMTVDAAAGRWMVPPGRAVWLQAHVDHQIRMHGEVGLRTLLLDVAMSPHLPARSCVLDISPLLRELIAAAHGNPAGYDANKDANTDADARNWHMLQLLLHELASVTVLPLYLPLPLAARLRSLCELLMATPGKQVTIETWAGQLGISTSTLHRLFLRQTGMRFGHWRQQARLLQAMEQLARGGKVAAAAQDQGYSSQSAFSAMFKKHFGSTPTAFYR
ncbi:AraC family transcriptional regulator [Collimonas fungivorans]|uniref:Transcriptional regulator, AraC family n=1 Tax=Collimonas fungivorans (strain Ter331) TaxID=1005048 RepID=G0ABP5_COLFT|nr:helix-turn-helix transcriptional regulator [Collimonas fungivorans]AEK61851.1 transcriptional regulator, AraC family [Collimonas fungivorans Ter331]